MNALRHRRHVRQIPANRPPLAEALETRRLLSASVEAADLAGSYAGSFAYKEDVGPAAKGTATLTVDPAGAGSSVTGTLSSPLFSATAPFTGTLTGKRLTLTLDADGDGADDQIVARVNRSATAIKGRLVEADGDRGRFKVASPTSAANASTRVAGAVLAEANAETGADPDATDDGTTVPDVPVEGEPTEPTTPDDGTTTPEDPTTPPGDGTDDGDGGGEVIDTPGAIEGTYTGDFAQVTRTPLSTEGTAGKVGTGIDPIIGYEPSLDDVPSNSGGTSPLAAGDATLSITDANDNTGGFSGSLAIDGVGTFNFVGFLGFPGSRNVRIVLTGATGGLVRGVLGTDGRFAAEMMINGADSGIVQGTLGLRETAATTE